MWWSTTTLAIMINNAHWQSMTMYFLLVGHRQWYLVQIQTQRQAEIQWEIQWWWICWQLLPIVDVFTFFFASLLRLTPGTSRSTSQYWWQAKKLEQKANSVVIMTWMLNVAGRGLCLQNLAPDCLHSLLGASTCQEGNNVLLEIICEQIILSQARREQKPKQGHLHSNQHRSLACHKSDWFW